MKNVVEIKGKAVLSGPGMYGYAAEAVVYGEDNQAVYVQVNAFESFRSYTVADKSNWAYMVESTGEPVEDFKEEYETLVDAKESEYYKVFETLSEVVTRMENGI